MGHIYKSLNIKVNLTDNHYFLKCDGCDRPEETRYKLLPENKITIHKIYYDVQEDGFEDRLNNYAQVTFNNKLYLFCKECWEEMYHKI